MSENNLYNKLPDEIILKILYRIDNIKDLINIYKASKKLKNMVTSEIVRHFNKNDCSNIYKYFNESKDFDDFEDFKESSNKYGYYEKTHFYRIIASENQLDISTYLESYNEIIKNYSLKKIRKLYHEHIIYRLIIDSILFCSICNYNYNFSNPITLYKCFNCHRYICRKCCSECDKCNIYKYDSYIYYHCKKCEYKCFDNMLKKLKNINIKKGKEDFEILKKTILDEYTNRIDFDDIEEMDDHNFIDDLILKDEIKSILKKYSNEI